MRLIDKLIIHCSYTPPSQDIGVETIRRWHTAPRFNDATGTYMFKGAKYSSTEALPAEARMLGNGNGWTDIGYHFVITRGARVEVGRSVVIPGAHTKGHNKHSIGICMVGGMDPDTRHPATNFTHLQQTALQALCKRLVLDYPITSIKGHKHYAPDRECPCFDVQLDHLLAFSGMGDGCER